MPRLAKTRTFWDKGEAEWQRHKTATKSKSTTRENWKPLELTLGNGLVIAGFEKAIVGMNPGESKTVDIPVDEAYGPYLEEHVATVTRDGIPDDGQPKLGEVLTMRSPEGQESRVRVKAMSDNSITLDGNHPLAGKDLTFDIELVEIG